MRYFRVQRASARLRITKLAAATTVFSAAAVATATPTGVHTPEEQAILMAVAPTLETRELSSGSLEIADKVDSVRILDVPKGDLGLIRHRNFAVPEELPPSGQLTAFDIGEPHSDRALPPMVFAVQKSTADGAGLSYSAFAKPREVVLARKSEARRAVAEGRRKRKPVHTSTVLAYARTPDNELEAPFDALLGGSRRDSADAADGIFLPRPRPDDATVAALVAGIDKDQNEEHDWANNPLPAIVHTAKEQKCLAEGVYFEARGEPEAGQAAVAQVILNRVKNPTYPDTICGVVYQNKHWRNRCQFSFACDGIKDRIRSQKAWATAQRIARDVTNGKMWSVDVGDSTHYHANYVRPRWARAMRKMERVGAHIFYRTRLGGWS
jgi:spore germination cell wall hydrolase CwlJ-like protein